eukprot:CAMPEP_0204384776 /NCGR_PEP_ID=MMETSP0469-20131031/57162_1 /ASSEMBLY_ACC=CAM_ASM_000384 /TAXON_ID=2969 /ORGANISM="Oxyrrhis marina" /LENGTH=42 /DNA_ID= /DNA_START= /DNA_END= /DNA_ORIENTATION=
MIKLRIVDFAQSRETTAAPVRNVDSGRKTLVLCAADPCENHH